MLYPKPSFNKGPPVAGAAKPLITAPPSYYPRASITQLDVRRPSHQQPSYLSILLSQQPSSLGPGNDDQDATSYADKIRFISALDMVFASLLVVFMLVAIFGSLIAIEVIPAKDVDVKPVKDKTPYIVLIVFAALALIFFGGDIYVACGLLLSTRPTTPLPSAIFKSTLWFWYNVVSCALELFLAIFFFAEKLVWWVPTLVLVATGLRCVAHWFVHQFRKELKGRVQKVGVGEKPVLLPGAMVMGETESVAEAPPEEGRQQDDINDAQSEVDKNE